MALIPARWQAAWDTLPENCLEREMIREIASLRKEVERLQNQVFDKQKLYTDALLEADRLRDELENMKRELAIYKPTVSIEIGGTHGS